MILYIDAQSVASGALTGNVGAGEDSMYLSTDALYNTGYCFAGKIDDLLVEQVAISATEIRDLYERGKPLH